MTKTEAIIVLRLAEIADVDAAYRALGADEIGAAMPGLLAAGDVKQSGDDMWSTFEAQDVAWAVWASMTDTDIEYGTGWNCCAAKPAKVIVFDNGARWAVCAGCASRYPGEVQELPSRDITDPGKAVT
jgi:hypothetical protein